MNANRLLGGFENLLLLVILRLDWIALMEQRNVQELLDQSGKGCRHRCNLHWPPGSAGAERIRSQSWTGDTDARTWRQGQEILPRNRKGEESAPVRNTPCDSSPIQRTGKGASRRVLSFLNTPGCAKGRLRNTSSPINPTSLRWKVILVKSFISGLEYIKERKRQNAGI